MSVELVEELVKRHNALLKYYEASEDLLALGLQDPSKIANASGLEKQVCNTIVQRFSNARILALKTLEK